jgi:tetratricopeptide (TPR) repeat protein
MAHGTSHLDDAQAAVERGEVQQDIDALLALLKTEPGNPLALQQLAELGLTTSRPEVAKDFARRLIDTLDADASEERIESALGVGQALFRAGLHPEAVNCFQAILLIQAADCRTTRWLAQAQLADGQLEQGFETLSRAQSLASGDAEQCREVGRLYLAHRRLSRAVACLQRAHELDPDDAVTLHLLGNGQRAAGHLEDAEASYREALEIEPSALLLHDLARIRAYRSGDEELESSSTLAGRFATIASTMTLPSAISLEPTHCSTRRPDSRASRNSKRTSNRFGNISDPPCSLRVLVEATRSNRCSSSARPDREPVWSSRSCAATHRSRAWASAPLPVMWP